MTSLNASGPASQDGFLSQLASTVMEEPTAMALVIGGLIALYLLNVLTTPRLDAREPPLLKPAVPLVGHIIGLLRHQSGYHQILLYVFYSRGPVDSRPPTG